jgi:muramidase (phage lysozyme)
MDKSVPAGAAILLDFVGETEAPDGYDTLYGNNHKKLKRKLTSMTFDEVVKAGPGWTKRYGSSACGRYQFMRDTLDSPKSVADLRGELGLRGDELFDADLQDRLGFHLLKRRGYGQFMTGKIHRTEFGKRLAMEWASFPVLAKTKGAHRTLQRGQSYYAGDGVNKALVKPEAVEAVLDRVKVTTGANVAPAKPVPAPAAPSIFTDATTLAVVQRKLYDLGYTEVGSRRADGSFDGVFGGMTRAAILIFRADNDLPAVDAIDQELLDTLDTAPKRKLARNDASADQVRQTVPEAKSNWLNKLLAGAVAVPALVGGVVDGALSGLGSARGYIEPMLSSVPAWAWLLLIACVAGYVFWNSRNGEHSAIKAFRAGERR